MKRLAEFKDDEAMDVLADILKPSVNIMKNENFVDAFRGNEEKGIEKDRTEAVRIAITECRKDVVTIMAVMNQTPIEEFHYDLLTLPKMLLQLFNDKDLLAFFKSQGQTDSAMSSGSAMESTEEDQSTSSDM